MKKGITAVVALTILLSGISYATERKGESARTSPTDKVGTQNSITLKSDNAPPSVDRSTTRSAQSKGGHLLPLDYVLLEMTHGFESKAKRNARGEMAGSDSNTVWLSSPSWPTTQRHGRITGRNLRGAPSAVGGQIWIQTIEHPNGVKEIEIRNIYGQPIHWSVEANAWATYGLLTAD
jgi:hypothetical protein